MRLRICLGLSDLVALARNLKRMLVLAGLFRLEEGGTPGSGIRDCAQQSSDESKQAELHYQGEISSRLELLDAARKYLQAELNHLYAERTQWVEVADLFKALGDEVGIPRIS